jgi:uncharacterized protein
MHDIPYVKNDKFGPEITSSMTVATMAVRELVKCPLGIQVLACGGREALAIAKSVGANFIRNEGYVFSHVGDEGFIDSNAGTLLRYRKMIDANDVLIFSDIKKKHSSHAITSDISLLDTAHAAKFFKADGIILTGKSTGDATDLNEVKLISSHRRELNMPIIIGSGVTRENVKDYVSITDAIILGSHFKVDGNWANELDGERIGAFMKYSNELNVM